MTQFFGTFELGWVMKNKRKFMSVYKICGNNEKIQPAATDRSSCCLSIRSVQHILAIW